MKFVWNEDHMESDFEFGKLLISGDETKGFRPFQLMVSAIASCSGAVFNNILVKQRTEYESLTINAEVERDESNANRIEKIVLNFNIKGKELNEQKLKRNLEISRKHCSMVQSVQDSIHIVENLTLLES